MALLCGAGFLAGISFFTTEAKPTRDIKEFLERVEKITIIDSISVDTEDFLKAYRLPASAGALLPPDSVPVKGHGEYATMVFANENRDFMMWAEADSTGNTRLSESILLTNGQWSAPTQTPEILSEGGSADFPFMMSDGTTLYYASDGEGSIGGLDIFVATRDAATGEYLQPQNIGLPYNSPYDDYMFAIDELNGIGWWATDRNQIPGKVTIYAFLVNDIRRNHDSEELDEEELKDFARISSWKDTWYDEEDTERAKEALNIIRSIVPNERRRQVDFYLPVGKGKIYTSFDELPDASTRSLMRRYLDEKAKLEKFQAELLEKRRSYHDRPTKASGQEIARMENEEAALKTGAKKALGKVYEALGIKF